MTPVTDWTMLSYALAVVACGLWAAEYFARRYWQDQTRYWQREARKWLLEWAAMHGVDKPPFDQEID